MPSSRISSGLRPYRAQRHRVSRETPLAGDRRRALPAPLGWAAVRAPGGWLPVCVWQPGARCVRSADRGGVMREQQGIRAHRGASTLRVGWRVPGRGLGPRMGKVTGRPLKG
jgi:hypothetical protein